MSAEPTTHTSRRARLAAALAIIAAITLAAPAIANADRDPHGTITVDCGEIEGVFADYYHGDGIDLENQPAAEPNWLRVNVDGVDLVDRWFGESTSFVVNLDPSVAHSYVITVASVSSTGEGPWIGTTTVCPAPVNAPQSVTPAALGQPTTDPAAPVAPLEQPATAPAAAGPVPTVAPALPSTGTPSGAIAAAAAATTALGLLTLRTARRRHT